MRRALPIVLSAGLLALGVALALGPGRGLLGRFAGRFDRRPEAPLRAERLPALDAAAEWINGGPPGPDALRGRVVVVAVFSDTDPAALDALRMLQTWHQAYGRFGLRVIGILAPEYAFAAARGSAERFASRLGLDFPIALDPMLWLAHEFGAEPGSVRMTIADPAGVVRASRILARPAAELSSFEHVVREELRALHPEIAFPRDDAGDPGPPAASASPVPRSVHLGGPAVVDGPLARAERGRAQPFTAEFRFQVEGTAYVPYPVGWWSPEAEGVVAARGGAANFLAIRYDAARVGVVAAPPPWGRARIWVLRDDAWLPADALGEDARLDARGASYFDVTEPRLYLVCRGAGNHVLKLSPEAPGVTFYAFTFEPPAGAATP